MSAETNGGGVENPAYNDASDGNHAPTSHAHTPPSTKAIGPGEDSPLPAKSNGTSHPDKAGVVEDGDEETGRQSCGLGPVRPQCVQCCNRPVGFLVFVSIFGFVQGMTVNGLVYVVTTTLERRFNIPSVQSGFISSCYDFGVLLIVIFVTYFGEKAHKPVWLGVGALFFSVGSILFTVPHYATGYYQFQAVDIPTCDLNSTTTGSMGDLESGLNRFLVVFIVAQLIHGISASGLYTLGYTYLDENTRPDRSSIYIGIFQASSLLGPACGYLVGGVTLDFYTDINVDTSTLGIDSDSPLWIGAWWTGFLITAALSLMVAFPLMAYPRSLPGKKKNAERVSEAQKGAEFKPRAGLGNSVKDFPRAVWCLLKNLPFMFISCAAVTEWFLLTSFATFGPKYLETQFSMTASDAALLAGYIIIPAGLVGTVIGGVVVAKLKLHFRGMVRMALICLVFAICCIPSFVISCDNPRMAGVTVLYDNSSLTFEEMDPVLVSSCNMNCSCGNAFDPVCGSNNVMYYTPCHAGCLVINETDSVTTVYSDCGCIQQDLGAPGGAGTAVSGKCSEACSYRLVFIVMFFVMLMFTLMATVPLTMATMRCVSYDQRSFALGFQSVVYRGLGTIPSPVVYGALIDNTCILWEVDDSGGRQCWQYDNAAFSRTSLILALVARSCSIAFLVACLCCYKAGPQAEGEEEGAAGVAGAEEASAHGRDDTKL